MKRLKVVRLVPQLDYGGVESIVALQAALMDHERFELRVCTFWRAGHCAELVRKAGVSVDVLGEDPSIKNPRALAKLYLYLQQHSPDVLHASIGEALFHGSIAGAMAGVPLRIMEEVGIPTRGRLAQTTFFALSQLSHRFIGVSQAVCDYLTLQEHVSPQKVRLVYNTVDPSFFEPITRTYEVEDRPFRFLVVGRLEPVKNQAALIHAVARMRDQGIDVQLDIAGKGALMDDFTHLIDTLNLHEHVNLLGFRSDLTDLLALADAYILSSHTEGLGMSMVEAQAQAVPVLSSSAAALKETFGPLDRRYMVDATDIQGWAEAMTLMVRATPEQRAEHARQGQHHAQAHFSPEHYIATLQALYQESSS